MSKGIFSMVFMKKSTSGQLLVIDYRIQREVILSVHVCETQDEAILTAQSVMMSRGYRPEEWQMVLAQRTEIPEIKQIPLIIEKQPEDPTFRNLVLKKIIDEKNLSLMNELGDLFSENEKKYLTEKINAEI